MVELLLKLTHLLHQLVGVIGGHELRDLVEAVKLHLDLAEALLHVSADGFLFIQLRFLLQDPDGRTGRQEGITVIGLVQTGHDAQDARLAGPVGAHDADLGSRQEAERDVVKDDLVAVRLADLAHGVDEFGHCHILGRRLHRQSRRVGVLDALGVVTSICTACRATRGLASGRRWLGVRRMAGLLDAGDYPGEIRPDRGGAHFQR